MARWNRSGLPSPPSHITQEMKAADQGSRQREVRPPGPFHRPFWRSIIHGPRGVAAQYPAMVGAMRTPSAALAGLHHHRLEPRELRVRVEGPV